MTSSGNEAKRSGKRKFPAERRDELLECAVGISRTDGLAAVSLRRVALDHGVTPGLVSHYFATAEQLVIATFQNAALADYERVFAAIDLAPTPIAKIWTMIDVMLDQSSVDASALWLDAWSLGRRNRQLADEVDRMNQLWQERVAEIVASGIAAGEFVIDDALDSTIRLLTMIDGLGAQMVIRPTADAATRRIAAAFVESEFGISGS